MRSSRGKTELSKMSQLQGGAETSVSWGCLVSRDWPCACAGLGTHHMLVPAQRYMH